MQFIKGIYILNVKQNYHGRDGLSRPAKAQVDARMILALIKATRSSLADSRGDRLGLFT